MEENKLRMKHKFTKPSGSLYGQWKKSAHTDPMQNKSIQYLSSLQVSSMWHELPWYHFNYQQSEGSTKPLWMVDSRAPIVHGIFLHLLRLKYSCPQGRFCITRKFRAGGAAGTQACLCRHFSAPGEAITGKPDICNVTVPHQSIPCTTTRCDIQMGGKTC